jgi:uncharacterized phage protein gp47/JayE
MAALAVSEPDLDTTIGSVTRKIIDAVASQISDASIDNQLLTYQYDINSKVGADLDAFVQLFGMSRYPASRATGVITFTRGTSTDVISVPVNAQVTTSDGSVIFQALAPAILDVGALSASVPVQAVTAGPAGNVPAGSLTVLQTPASEISAVTNTQATSGGANQETDSQLQARWKATVFKSMAGTEQMFVGIALNNSFCLAANVVGSSTRRREQVQIAGGAAVSTVTDAQYVYPSGQVVGRDIDSGDVAAPGSQYTWNYSVNPPQILVIDASYFPDGEVVDLSFLYLDDSSRNDPASGILNRVDVWCAGTDAVPAAQSLEWTGAVSFSSTSTDPYFTGDFINPDGTPPTAGNIFLALAFGPILTLPSTIIIGSTTYGLASAVNPMGTVSGSVHYAYQIVHQKGAAGWSASSLFGLEWSPLARPAEGTPFSISQDYTYNQIPYSVQQDIANWKLAGTDVLAHQALVLFLQFSLAVIYDPSVTVSTTQAAISTAISNYLAQLGFNSRVYPSSVIQVVENTPGVSACRFITGADIPGYNPSNPNAHSVGIQGVVNGAVVHSYVDAGGNPVDVEIGDDTVPSFGAVQLTTKAPNSFGSFA